MLTTIHDALNAYGRSLVILVPQDSRLPSALVAMGLEARSLPTEGKPGFSTYQLRYLLTDADDLQDLLRSHSYSCISCTHPEDLPRVDVPLVDSPSRKEPGRVQEGYRNDAHISVDGSNVTNVGVINIHESSVVVWFVVKRFPNRSLHGSRRRKFSLFCLRLVRLPRDLDVSGTAPHSGPTRLMKLVPFDCDLFQLGFHENPIVRVSWSSSLWCREPVC